MPTTHCYRQGGTGCGGYEWVTKRVMELAYLAMFLNTKRVPGREPVMTDSGTLESEQPIHRIWGRR